MRKKLSLQWHNLFHFKELRFLISFLHPPLPTIFPVNFNPSLMKLACKKMGNSTRAMFKKFHETFFYHNSLKHDFD
jgi:hypothetical protein